MSANNNYKLENPTTIDTDLTSAQEEIEEQYRILKEEEEKEAKRKSLILIALFFFIFTISFTGAAFSYMTYKKALENETNSSLEKGKDQNGKHDTRELVILYNAGTEFVAEDIIPGWESIGAKDFSVSNNGNLSADYNIVFTNIENTFTNLQELRYTIKCNGVVLLDDMPVPASEQIILEKQTIFPGTVNNYEIFFKYVETGVAQNEDAAKNYKLSVMVTPTE